MTRFDTRWLPLAEATSPVRSPRDAGAPAERRGPRLRSARPGPGAAALAALGLVSLVSQACVTKGRYDEDTGRLEAENAELTRRAENLERSNDALEVERVRLVDEMEDLRQARETLDRDVAKLQKTKDLLTEHLRKRDEEVAELSRLSTTYENLVSDLQEEVTSGQIEIEQLRDGIRLRKVSTRLRSVNHRVEVQGHSDNVPLSRSLTRRYGSNWELAAARASQVVRLFEKEGVEPARLSVISFGQWAPVADNGTPEGRALNRRIDIRLIPVDAPAAAASPDPARPAP
jgi:chemotaxis protein MotB